MRSLLLPAALLMALSAPRIGSAAGSAGVPLESRPRTAYPLTSVEPGPAFVETGDSAPDVSWESPDGWKRLRELRQQGAVLLVFGAREQDLARLERDRPALLRLGVVPAVVLERRSGSCASLARRMQLGYPILPDPQRVIGSQYNTLEASTRHSGPAWFVVDRAGRVRGASRGEFPDGAWSNAVASALSLPQPGVPLPASRR